MRTFKIYCLSSFQIYDIVNNKQDSLWSYSFIFIHPVIFFHWIPRQTSALCIVLIYVPSPPQAEGGNFWKIVYLLCINLGSRETETNRI